MYQGTLSRTGQLLANDPSQVQNQLRLLKQKMSSKDTWQPEIEQRPQPFTQPVSHKQQSLPPYPRSDFDFYQNPKESYSNKFSNQKQNNEKDSLNQYWNPPQNKVASMKNVVQQNPEPYPKSYANKYQDEIQSYSNNKQYEHGKYLNSNPNTGDNYYAQLNKIQQKDYSGVKQDTYGGMKYSQQNYHVQDKYGNQDSNYPYNNQKNGYTQPYQQSNISQQKLPNSYYQMSFEQQQQYKQQLYSQPSQPTQPIQSLLQGNQQRQHNIQNQSNNQYSQSQRQQNFGQLDSQQNKYYNQQNSVPNYDMNPKISDQKQNYDYPKQNFEPKAKPQYQAEPSYQRQQMTYAQQQQAFKSDNQNYYNKVQEKEQSNHYQPKEQYQQSYQNDYNQQKDQQPQKDNFPTRNREREQIYERQEKQEKQEKYQPPPKYKPTLNPIDELPAVAKKQAILPPAENDDGNLEECPEGCGRNFKPDALEKHVKVCKKVFQSKRKEFNSKAHRQIAQEQAKLEKQGLQKDKIIQQKKADPKWKKQSEQFRNMLKATKNGDTVEAEVDDDLVECPTCHRRFNESAAQRHMPGCRDRKMRK
ncbi:Zinc finger C2HC domain-containing protein 1A [Paramecium bursaria]